VWLWRGCFPTLHETWGWLEKGPCWSFPSVGCGSLDRWTDPLALIDNCQRIDTSAAKAMLPQVEGVESVEVFKAQGVVKDESHRKLLAF
jgi:hypothetical protein